MYHISPLLPVDDLIYSGEKELFVRSWEDTLILYVMIMYSEIKNIILVHKQYLTFAERSTTRLTATHNLAQLKAELKYHICKIIRQMITLLRLVSVVMEGHLIYGELQSSKKERKKKVRPIYVCGQHFGRD